MTQATGSTLEVQETQEQEERVMLHPEKFEPQVYRIEGTILDKIFIPFVHSNTNLAFFMRDGGVVIGQIRDKEGHRYVKDGSYDLDGAVARISDGPEIGRGPGLWMQFYKSADPEGKKYVERAMLHPERFEPQVYSYNGFSIDQSAFALGRHQNSIGHFSRDGGVVIGKLRDIEQKIEYAVKGRPYNMDGAVARIDGGSTQESGSPSLRFYRDADPKTRKYVFNVLVEWGLIDKKPIKALTHREEIDRVVTEGRLETAASS